MVLSGAINKALAAGTSGQVRGPGWARGTFFGAIAGLTSFAAHAGGPPITMYLVPQKLERGIYQATTVIVFVAINYMKLIPYWWLGQFTTENLTTSLILLPLAPVGIWLGVWLHRRVSDTMFYRFVLLALVATGGKLVCEVKDCPQQVRERFVLEQIGIFQQDE